MLQRCNNSPGLYVPGNITERLYKRVQMAHDNYEEGFVLGIEDFAPTASEANAVSLRLPSLVAGALADCASVIVPPVAKSIHAI